jgi:hypothetical protein
VYIVCAVCAYCVYSGGKSHFVLVKIVFSKEVCKCVCICVCGGILWRDQVG